MTAGNDHSHGGRVRLRLARRRVGALLRSWRWPRFASSPIAVGLVEAWGVEPREDGGISGYVCLRFVANSCARSALAEELCLRLRSLGLDHAAVKVSLDRPWSRANLSDAARLDLGLW